MKQNLLGTESIRSLFTRYVIPACIAMIITGMQMMIDGYFLGNYVGYSALASVNLIQPFMQIIMGCSMIVSVGSLSYISRLLGAGDSARAANAFKTAVMALTIVALLILVVGVSLNYPLALMLGASPMLLEGAAGYIQVISLFAPFISLMFLFGFINRAIGKPNLYLKGAIFSVLVNVCLDALFIQKYGFGIPGAAFATGFAYLSAFLIVVKPVLNKKNVLNLFTGTITLPDLLPMIYNGASEGIVAISSGVTIYLFNVAFMDTAGETGVAALAIINYMTQLGILILFGISDGITTIVSYNYGAGQEHRVKEILRLALTIGFLLGGVFFVGLMFFSGDIIGLFGSDRPEITELAKQGAGIYAVAFLFNGFNIILSGYYTALGDAHSSVLLSSSRGLIFVILGIAILPAYLGVMGIWLTVPLAEIMTFFIGLFLIFWKRQKTMTQVPLVE